MIQRRILLAAIFAAGLASPAVGQNFSPPNPPNPPGSAPAPTRRGGLLPQRTPASPLAPVSREELMRRFDLNADGKIDEAEAEMARSRMRRERADIMRNSSIDPLTGRPRGAPPPEPPQKPAGIQAAEVAPPAAKPKDDELLLVPGRPDGTPAPATQTPSAKTQPPTGRPSASAARQPVPTRQLPTATTGGVRAGAPAARPGYGALGPRADLNAGRQPTAPTKPAPAARPTIGRAPTPRPIAPPRITAEDIGQ
jgi:hypothetical protein